MSELARLRATPGPYTAARRRLASEARRAVSFPKPTPKPLGHPLALAVRPAASGVGIDADHLAFACGRFLADRMAVEGAFGLREAPFAEAPDERFFYVSAQTRELVAELASRLSAGARLVLLSGEAGAGKTALVRYLRQRWAPHVRLLAPELTARSAEELLWVVARELGLAELPAALVRSTETLGRSLVAQSARRPLVLLLDEAQRLSEDALEQIRLLSNLCRSSGQPAIQFLLAGQRHLEDTIGRPEAAAVQSRISFRGLLEPLGADDVAAYIEHRLGFAGWQERAPLFTSEAVGIVARVSGGVPQRINHLCSQAMMNAYGAGRRQIESAAVVEAAFDLGWSRFGACTVRSQPERTS